eukprot:322823-Prymnesium_polylepis.1
MAANGRREGEGYSLGYLLHDARLRQLAADAIAVAHKVATDILQVCNGTAILIEVLGEVGRVTRWCAEESLVFELHHSRHLDALVRSVRIRKRHRRPLAECAVLQLLAASVPFELEVSVDVARLRARDHDA